MNITTLVGVIVSILGGLGILSAAFIVVKSSLSRTTAELWKSEAEAYKSRVETLEEEVGELKKELNEAKDKVSILTKVITGETTSEALKDYMEVWHNEARANHKEILTLLRDIKSTTRK